MGAAAGPMSLAAAGLSAGSSILGGFTNASNSAAQGEAAYMRGMQGAYGSALAGELADLKATQTDTALRQQLGSSLANIRAMAASANLDSRSPTTQAIFNRTQYVGMQADATMQQSLHLESMMDRSSSVLQAMGAQQALQAGYANGPMQILNGMLGGAGSLLKSASGMDWKWLT